MSIGISAARHAERLAQVTRVLHEHGVAALIAGVGPELEWLVGYAAVGHERLNLLVVDAAGAVTFISPRLEVAAALATPTLGSGDIPIVSWADGEDPFAPAVERITAASGEPGRVAVSDGLRAAFLLGIQELLPQWQFEVASTVLAPLRRVKDDEERALLAEAASAADRVVEAVIAGRLVGRSEADIAREVRERLVTEGHDSAEFAIVGSGPNSASPHHEPGDRVVVAGEPLLLDIGGRKAGYCSDITRTVWVTGEPSIGPEAAFATVYETVEHAQAAGREAARPGVARGAVDSAARDVISAAGHGEHFFHRLGHGIGLEVHEEPYLVAGDAGLLEAGNAFSIEPGIYLDGTYGVRIEDIVVCGPGGARTLNQVPRELIVVRGL